MYPTITMPAEDCIQELLTTMASGAMPATSEDYTASEDIMDISSYAPSISSHATSLPNAIPTSVITPTTSLTGGSWLEHPNNIHGGSFVPPTVSSHNGYHHHAAAAVVRSVGAAGLQTGQHPHHPHQRIGRDRGDMDIYRMSPGSAPRRRIRDDDLTPDEREKRRVRRERNKLAAAKCRQRRVDHTNTLINETEDWEEKNATLEQEISKLHQQKEQLEFILEAHKAMCNKNKANKETATTAACTTTTTRPHGANTVSSLDTPTTEVVTPTRLFNFAGMSDSVLDGGAHNSTTTGSSTSSSCGREAMSIKSENSSSGSDMSSPESARRTLIQL